MLLSGKNAGEQIWLLTGHYNPSYVHLFATKKDKASLYCIIRVLSNFPNDSGYQKTSYYLFCPSFHVMEDTARLSQT